MCPCALVGDAERSSAIVACVVYAACVAIKLKRSIVLLIDVRTGWRHLSWRRYAGPFSTTRLRLQWPSLSASTAPVAVGFAIGLCGRLASEWLGSNPSSRPTCALAVAVTSFVSVAAASSSHSRTTPLSPPVSSRRPHGENDTQEACSRLPAIRDKCARQHKAIRACKLARLRSSSSPR